MHRPRLHVGFGPPGHRGPVYLSTNTEYHSNNNSSNGSNRSSAVSRRATLRNTPSRNNNNLTSTNRARDRVVNLVSNNNNARWHRAGPSQPRATPRARTPPRPRFAPNDPKGKRSLYNTTGTNTLNDLPREVLDRIRGHLPFNNRRRLAQASRHMRNSVCKQCKAGLDSSGNIGIMATADYASNNNDEENGEYKLELWLMFEHWNDADGRSRAREYYRRLMGLGRVMVAGDGIAEVVLEFLNTKDGLETRLTFSPRYAVPIAVVDCFATCIMRQLRLRRKRIMDYILAARNEIEVGPTRMSQLNAALGSAVVTTQSSPRYSSGRMPYVYWRYWR